MAEEENNNKFWTSIGNSLASGVNQWDKMTSSMVDTIAPNNSQLDKLTSEFGNTSMLSNLLTSNAPTLNIKQGLEELCKLILTAEWDADIGKLLEKLKKKIGQLLTKIMQQITALLINAIYNAVLKLRRMVIAKLKAFLAEYVADACMYGLQEHLKDFANPQNALSIKEFCSSIGDMISDVDKGVSDIMNTIRTTIFAIYELFAGTKYAKALADHKKAVEIIKKENSKLDNDFKEAMKSLQILDDAIVRTQQERLLKQAYKLAKDNLDKKLYEAKDNLAVASSKYIFNEQFWTIRLKQITGMITDMLCARTASFVQSQDFGLKAGINKEIKGFMQGCLFQQALKTAKKINPDSMTSDVLARLDNLSRSGNMLDAYNVAMAAGIDLSSSAFQIELPSANGWVSTIYGDPYMFSPETPLNSTQIAKYLTDDLPTASQMMEGTLTEEQKSKSYIAENFDNNDSAVAAVSKNINGIIQMNKDIVSGVEATGNSIAYSEASAPIVSNGVSMAYVDPNEYNMSTGEYSEINLNFDTMEILSNGTANTTVVVGTDGIATTNKTNTESVTTLIDREELKKEYV